MTGCPRCQSAGNGQCVCNAGLAQGQAMAAANQRAHMNNQLAAASQLQGLSALAYQSGSLGQQMLGSAASQSGQLGQLVAASIGRAVRMTNVTERPTAAVLTDALSVQLDENRAIRAENRELARQAIELREQLKDLKRDLARAKRDLRRAEDEARALREGTE